MRLHSLLGGTAALLLVVGDVEAGKSRVELTGTVAWSSISTGPLAGAGSGDAVTVRFDVATPGYEWSPAPADGREYAILPETFTITAGGGVLDMSTGSGALVLIDGLPVSDRLQVDASGLPGGLNLGLSTGFDGSAFDSLDLIEQYGAYGSQLTSYDWLLSGAGVGAMGIDFGGITLSASDLGQPFCFGDGSSVYCPCVNESELGAGEGCANSQGHGAVLSAVGSGTVAADDAVFRVAQARPMQTGMLVQGATETAFPFKDGVLCAGNPTVRLEVIRLDADGAGATQGSIVTDGAVQPGQSRVYQFWYRDPALSPCGSGSNFTNAVSVDWD